MTTFLIILCIILYLIGAFFFAMLTGRGEKTTDIPVILFYPITMWFIK